VILAGVVHCVIVMGLAFRRKLPGAGIMLTGFLLLATAATNDILHDTKVIATFYSLNLGLFAFLFSQSLIIGGLFSRSLHQVEELNETLEIKVAERTSELEVLSRSDPLTGLSNRRHFWTQLSREWERWTRYQQDFNLRRPNGLSPVDRIVRRPGLSLGPFIFDSRGILCQVDGFVEVECHSVSFDRVWPSTPHTGSPSCRRFSANPASATKGMPRRLPTLWLGWTSFLRVPIGRGAWLG